MEVLEQESLTPAAIMRLQVTQLTSLIGVGIVGSWMLFPDDAAWRDKFVCYLAAMDFRERAETGCLPSGFQHEDIGRLLELAGPLEELEKQQRRRALRGEGAGMMLYNGVLRIGRAEREPMGRTAREIKESIWRKNNSTHVHQVLKFYRPVAALWAEFVRRDDGRAEIAFPCLPSDLPSFLALSEQFREIAETTFPPRRKGPVLAPGVSVRLPDDVKATLPKVVLDVYPHGASTEI